MSESPRRFDRGRRCARPRVVTRRLPVAIVAAVVALAGCSKAARADEEPSSTTIRPRPAPVLLVRTRGGVILPVLRPSGRGWRVETPCGASATIDTGTPIRQIDVVLDPGHGGIQTGAVGYGLRESDLNLDVSRRVRTELERVGITAALTRDADYRLPIATRALIINTAKPKLFVSVNHNGGPAANHTGPGTEVYYQRASARARRLAGLLWQSVYTKLNTFPAHWVGASDAGAIYRLGRDGRDFYGVLRLAPKIPGTLLEGMYLTEASEAALLAQASFRAAEAQAIATGITRYLRTKLPGTGYHVPIDRGFGDPGGGGGFTNCTDPPLA